MHTTIRFSMLLCFSLFLIQCSSNHPVAKEELYIYNMHHEESKEKFRSLNLDGTYTDLVPDDDPENIRMKEATVAFSDFAYSISDYLEENNFDWEIPDSTINLFMRGYFTPDGSLEHFIYKVKSGNVPQEKIEEFGKTIKPFLKDIKFDIQQENKFAQCGSVQYWTK